MHTRVDMQLGQLFGATAKFANKLTACFWGRLPAAMPRELLHMLVHGVRNANRRTNAHCALSRPGHRQCTAIPLRHRSMADHRHVYITSSGRYWLLHRTETWANDDINSADTVSRQTSAMPYGLKVLLDVRILISDADKIHDEHDDCYRHMLGYL